MHLSPLIYIAPPLLGILFFLAFPRDPQWQIVYSHYRSVTMNGDLSMNVGLDFTMAIYNPNFIGAEANNLTAQLFHEDMYGVERHFGVLRMEPFSLPPRGHALVSSNATVSALSTSVGAAVLRDLAQNEGVVKLSFRTQTTVHLPGGVPAEVDADCAEWILGDRTPMRILDSRCRFQYGFTPGALLPSFLRRRGWGWAARPAYVLRRRKGREQLYTGGPMLELPSIDEPLDTHLLVA